MLGVYFYFIYYAYLFFHYYVLPTTNLNLFINLQFFCELKSNNIFQLETDNSTDLEESYQNIPRFTVEELQSFTDLNVEHNNATVTPLWKRYLEGIFNVSDVSLDFENDKILLSKPDLRYLAQVAAYLAKSPPVLIELYIWIKVSTYKLKTSPLLTHAIDVNNNNLLNDNDYFLESSRL